MKRLLTALLFALCSFVAADSFSPFYRLVGGTWKMKKKDGYSCEQWVKISDNELRSTAFNLKGRDTSIYERVRLTQKNGVITYLVIGADNSRAVAFKLTLAKNNQFVFSNPKHDFPQRVVYHFVKPDSVHAWVDGKYNGKPEKVDFYFKRVR